VGVKATAIRASGLVAHACVAVPAAEIAGCQLPKGGYLMREWVHGLFGLDAVKRQTARCPRTVLVVVHYLRRSPWA
jgi:hypothetical protein